MLTVFDSMSEYIRKVKAVMPRKDYEYCPKSEWTGNLSYQEAMNKAIKGDMTNVAKSMALLNDLVDHIPPTKICKIVKSPYGGKYHFGDWQSGAPLPMRRRVRVVDDAGPLKIVVSTTCSQGIYAETMEKRGITILALLLKLQEIRPVELYLLAELYGAKDGWNYQLIRMESRPLDLSVASFCLSNVGFTRQLTYSYGKLTDGFNGEWPRRYRNTDYVEKRRIRLNLSPSDMVVGEVYITDTLVQQPLKWLEEQLNQYRKE